MYHEFTVNKWSEYFYVISQILNISSIPIVLLLMVRNRNSFIHHESMNQYNMHYVYVLRPYYHVDRYPQ